MVMINDHIANCAANYAFTSGSCLVSAGIFSFVYAGRNPKFLTVFIAALTAPAIKTICLFVVQRKKFSSFWFFLQTFCAFQHFTPHFFNARLILLFGSCAVFGDVSFSFIPHILARKLSLREPPSGCGLLMSWPSAFKEARPLSFNPPEGFLPSLRVHAPDI